MRPPQPTPGVRRHQDPSCPHQPRPTTAPERLTRTAQLPARPTGTIEVPELPPPAPPNHRPRAAHQYRFLPSPGSGFLVIPHSPASLYVQFRQSLPRRGT